MIQSPATAMLRAFELFDVIINLGTKLSGKKGRILVVKPKQT
jgi:hypothetical protein